MRWRRVFPGNAVHARRAREFVRVLLDDTPVGADAVQVAAELVANAASHSASRLPGGLMIVELCRWQRGAALAVTDQGDPPGTSEPCITISADEPFTEHGRGLRIVDDLCASWGVRGGPAGRTVIAIFDW
jgi:anti-sigma regulatory factor (Ser/Thr protein kinase)